MAKLNKTESSLLLALIEKPGWAVLIKLMFLTITELNSRPCSGTNEFEVLRSIFTKEAKVEALQEFFKGIENGEPLTIERT